LVGRRKSTTFTAQNAAIMYIHQLKNWPEFFWDSEKITPLLAKVRHRQGKLAGRMEAMGFKLCEEASLKTLTLDVVKSNEIEGNLLDQEQVRSSIARRLGIDIGGLVAADRNVEGVVEMILDATQNHEQALTAERLFAWHAALFPTGHSGMYKIVTGNWRDNEKGPMQVVSGPMGREKVHFEAPDAGILGKEMALFLEAVNKSADTDPVLMAAVAHLWFVTIHPFDDGNGRIARAIADMLLARSDGSKQRFYSMSARIELDKKNYYDMLERTQKGSLDISAWIEWFLNCLDEALISAETTLASILKRASFWDRIAGIALNERQHFMINKLTDDFFGNLTSSKWAKMMKCSQDTALRDIQDLVQKEVMIKEESGGRSTCYILNNY
jgi:Fic family protein